MKKIRLTEDAYLDGGAGVHFAEGHEYSDGVYTAWAEDEDGNEYQVFWEIDDMEANVDDGSSGVDWDSPINIYNLTDSEYLSDEELSEIQLIL